METITDKNGMTWNAKPPKKAGGMWEGSLQQPAYGTGPGEVVIAATSKAALVVEADTYADEYIASGGRKPAPGGGGIEVNAKPPKKGGDSGALLFLVLLLALAKGNRR